MARKFRLPISPVLLIGGAIVAGGAFILWQNPNIINNILHPQPQSVSPTPPAAAAPITSVQQQPVVTPPLSQLETGGIVPYTQNAFCDSTLGLNWNPLTGRCEQNLQSASGNCAAGSHFDHNVCQCVPNGIPQPPGYRDCTTSCTDKVNQVWSWCVMGCIPKSAAYGNPRILACPPK